MLFLYYQSLQIRMGDEKVIEIKRKSLDRKKLKDRQRRFCSFREIRARIYISPLTIAIPTVSFFEGR